MAVLPSFMAWDIFGINNGTNSLKELNKKILKYKEEKNTGGIINIGCIILAEPFFFEESDWIPVPEDWNLSTVQGKTYDTETAIGGKLYRQVAERLNRLIKQNAKDHTEEQASVLNRNGQMLRQELGPGGFFISVMEAYKRSCSITGEKALPVLEAAHIRPCFEEGPNSVQNGILMRSDFHALFDKGYLTIDERYNIDISRRLKEDYGDGKMYYAYRGKQLMITPDNFLDLPGKEFLQWHNSKVFLDK
jgi:putative restriction endonuclease